MTMVSHWLPPYILVKYYYMYTLDLKTANEFLSVSLTPSRYLIHETTTHPTTQVSTAPLVLLVWDLGFVADTLFWLAD